MRSTVEGFLSSFAAAAVACSLAAVPPGVWGQESRPSRRPHILLPPSYGATPLSTILHANAALTAAAGDFLESAANARLTNSLAARQEMENSVEWVRTYFQRKEINKQYTRSPTFIEHERSLNKMSKSLIDSDYQVELTTDPSDKLNFMLLELNVKAPPEMFYSGVSNSLVDSKSDERLSSDDIRHIRLTDGGGASARLQFAADDVALKGRWPRVLRVAELEAPRAAVEQACNAAIDELKKQGQISAEASQALRDKLDGLAAALHAAYPKRRRTESMAAFSEYLAGERFLQAYAVGVHRMILTEDERAFDGSFRFDGDSVADLVAHMNKLGLRFAPWQPGDEGVYRRLFSTMRRFYQRFADDRAG
jgi:hypothetical protein